MSIEIIHNFCFQTSSFTKLGEFFVIVSVTSVSVLMYFISALSTLQNIMFGLSNISQKSQKYHSTFFIFSSECMCVCRCMCMCMYIHVHTFVFFFYFVLHLCVVLVVVDAIKSVVYLFEHILYFKYFNFFNASISLLDFSLYFAFIPIM